MAVFLDSVGGGDLASTSFYNSLHTEHSHTANGGELLVVAGLSFSAADLTLGPFTLGDNELSDLTRTVTYDGTSMTSIGVVQWGTNQGWTEVFVLTGVKAGLATVKSAVYGGVDSSRYVRCQTVSYSGVDSIGTPITGTGTGTAMSMSATVAAASVIVGVYGTRNSLVSFNGNQRYLSNTGIGLLMGDKAGTGASEALTATRQTSGAWGGLIVPVQAADTVATCDLLSVEPSITSKVHRQPRTGGLRRHVFKVPAE